MPTIAEVRAKYPQYNDLSDDDLANALHKKFYSDMPEADFKAKIGLMPESDAAKSFREFASSATQDPRAAKVQQQYDDASMLGKLFVTSDPQFNELPAWKQPLVAAKDIADLTVNGLSSGLGDRAVAGIRAPFTGKTYEQELTGQQALTQEARGRAGGAGTVAEIAGGLKTALALGGKGMTLSGVGMGTNGATGLALRSALMGGEGALYGAAAGAGNAAYGDELSGAGTGALWGLAGGVGGNVIGEGLGKVTEKLSRAWQNWRAAPDERAANAVLNAAREAGFDAETARKMLDDLGPDAMAVDILGKRGTALGRSAANISPEARETLESALLGRKAGQNERIVGTLEDLTGLPAGTRTTIDDYQKALYNEQAPAIRSAYEEARTAGFDLDPAQFDDVLKSPAGAEAYQKALPMVRNFDAINPPRVPERPAPPPQMSVDDAAAKLRSRVNGQERRAVNTLAPSAGMRPAKPMRLSEFVASQGGIVDHAGDAAAVAGGVKTRFGKLVRDDGKKSLDYMREAAEEAGYLGGYTSDEFGRASVDDFLRALEDDVRGTPIYAQEAGGDIANLDAWESANEMRSGVRTSADRIGQELSGTVDDDVFQRAVRNAEEGMDPDAALEKAISDNLFENGMPPQEVPAGLFDDPLNPGAKPKDYSELARLDMTKRLLDSKAKVAFRAGDDTVGTASSGIAKVLRERMDQSIAGPEYSTARGLRQKAFETERAADMGAELAGGRIPATLPGQARALTGDNASVRAKAYAIKQAENLLNRNATEGAYAKLSTPLGREAYEAALGDKAPGLAKRLAGERTFNTTTREITGNSTTARQLAEMLGGSIGGMGAAAAFGFDATTGGLAGAAMGALKRGGPAIQKHLATKSQKAMAPYVAELLTRKALPAARAPKQGALEKLTKAKRDALIRLIMGIGIHEGVTP